MSRDDEVFALLQRQQIAALIEREQRRTEDLALLGESLPVPYLPASYPIEDGAA